MIDNILAQLTQYPMFFEHIVTSTPMIRYHMEMAVEVIYFAVPQKREHLRDTCDLRCNSTTGRNTIDDIHREYNSVKGILDRVSRVSFEYDSLDDIISNLGEWIDKVSKPILLALPSEEFKIHVFPGTIIETLIIFWNDVIRVVFPALVKLQTDLNRHIQLVVQTVPVVQSVVDGLTRLKESIERISNAFIVGDKSNVHVKYLRKALNKYIFNGEKISDDTKGAFYGHLCSYLSGTTVLSLGSEVPNPVTCTIGSTTIELNTSYDDPLTVFLLLPLHAMRPTRTGMTRDSSVTAVHTLVDEVVTLRDMYLKKSDLPRINDNVFTVAEYKRIETELQGITEELGKKGDDLTSKRQALEKLQGEISTSRVKKTELESRKDELERSNAEKEAKRQQLVAEIRDISASIARSATSNISTLREELERKKTEEKNIREEIQPITSQIAQIQLDVVDLRGNITNLEKTKDRLIESIQQNETQIEGLKRSEHALSNLRSVNISELTTSIQQIQENISSRAVELKTTMGQTMFKLSAGGTFDESDMNLPTKMLKQLIKTTLFAIGFEVLSDKEGRYMYEMEQKEQELCKTIQSITDTTKKQTMFIERRKLLEDGSSPSATASTAASAAAATAAAPAASAATAAAPAASAATPAAATAATAASAATPAASAASAAAPAASASSASASAASASSASASSASAPAASASAASASSASAASTAAGAASVPTAASRATDDASTTYIFRLNRFFFTNQYTPLALVLLRYFGWNENNPVFPIDYPPEITEWTHLRLDEHLTMTEWMEEVKDLSVRRLREKQVYAFLQAREPDNRKTVKKMVRDLLDVIDVATFVTEENKDDAVTFADKTIKYIKIDDIGLLSDAIDEYKTEQTTDNAMTVISVLYTLMSNIAEPDIRSLLSTAAAAASSDDESSSDVESSSDDEPSSDAS
jgi:predicted  nucleic acid-binding Zn-ribbon protein